MVSSGALATPNNNCTNGNGSASSVASRSGSANLSTKKQGPSLTFNPIVKFFHVLQWNNQGVQIGKLSTLQKFQHKPHENLCEVYTQMWWLINVTQRITKVQAIQFWYGILDKELQRCLTHHAKWTNASNFGKCVPSFGMYQVQHGQKPSCDPQIQHGCTLEFFDQFITNRITTLQSIDKVQGASKMNWNTFVKLSYLKQ